MADKLGPVVRERREGRGPQGERSGRVRLGREREWAEREMEKGWRAGPEGKRREGGFGWASRAKNKWREMFPFFSLFFLFFCFLLYKSHFKLISKSFLNLFEMF